MTVKVKICGLRDAANIAAAAQAGAAYVGFVFFPKSPRNVSLSEAAGLAATVPEGVRRVALTVNADDAFLADLVAQVPLEMLQLHGSESPERVAEVRARFGLPVMKAIGIAEAGDLDKIAPYEAVADQILVDAKPPKGADLPGGNGATFDWDLIAGRQWQTPWMLAGGLTETNVAEALRRTGATQVDLSSAVESAPGVKDPTLIRRFLAAANP
ncbi:N-(5'-phosphoribosyl)anthranilate isomerase [Pseudoruegeria aquimaris]|uniref:N-(5'-phosphoribosyl)anthranilate isomerase n=1 Tax=Pseudoruegeria aquimaris TaxID=393663 RepID=A0A1Y5TNU2_9RHOB|nr:phosphoribosylanthranilate isomerase [Pseudoruegeria aquimaris]SLN64764.1 N-(5'-phosphoribosyl)anthranilate isomerase [Pseudoruegeria aquimaris]